MASSQALTLVNTLLRITGDYTDLGTISTSPNGIGNRMLEFLNLTIRDLARFGGGNWPQLLVETQGTTDGTTGIMEFSGTDDIRSDGPISVWIGNVTQPTLDEVTTTQFNEIQANDELSGGDGTVFRRGQNATTGAMQVQIYPVPPAGDIVNVSAYRRPTLLAADTDTTDFDDDLLIVGALKHADGYDGLDRGYANEYERLKNMLYVRLFGNMSVRIRTEDYH